MKLRGQVQNGMQKLTCKNKKILIIYKDRTEHTQVQGRSERCIQNFIHGRAQLKVFCYGFKTLTIKSLIPNIHEGISSCLTEKTEKKWISCCDKILLFT